MPINALPPSARSAAERAAWLDTLIDRVPVGIAVTVDRVLTEVNDHFCTLTGYHPSELIGQSTRMLYPSDAQYRSVGEAIYPQLRSQRAVCIETALRRKGGQIVDVALSITLVDPEHPELGVVSTLLDITAQRRAEQLLQARIALSEHAARGEHRDLVAQHALDAARYPSTGNPTIPMCPRGRASPVNSWPIFSSSWTASTRPISACWARISTS